MILIDRFLYYYSTLFAIILIVGALFSGLALTNLLATLIFLPVALTFIYSVIRDLHQRRNYPITSNSASHQLSSYLVNQPFSFSHFFAQRQPLFLATLALFVVTLTISILRAGLDFLPQPELLSPIPNSELLSKTPDQRISSR